jgi:hypothetical protein
VGTISPDDLDLLAETLRKTMTASSGHELDKALADLGWREMLDEMPDTAIPLVFKLLGETGAHAPVLNDVVLHEAGRRAGDTVPLPFAGGSWVIWERADQSSSTLDDELPIRRVGEAFPVPLADGRRALGLSGHPAPARGDSRRHRRRRGDAGWCRRRRPQLSAGQGRCRARGSDRGPTLSAGARRDRLHRRTRTAAACASHPCSRRHARQLTRAHQGGGSGVAEAGIGPATRRAVSGLTKDFLNKRKENTILIMRKLRSRTRVPFSVLRQLLHSVLLYSTTMFSFRCTNSSSR